MRSARQESISPRYGGCAPESRHQLNQLLRYSPALVLLAIAVADSARFADPDLWRHILAGQSILTTGHLPLRDPYSYSIPGHPWRNGEWLSDVIIAAFYNTLGAFGLKLMKFLCTSATLGLITMAAASEAPVQLQFFLLLIVAATWTPFAQFRPQLFTYLLLSLLLALLARDNYRGHTRTLWLAVPIMALWANLHGGFVVGVAVLGTYAGACLVVDLLQHREWRRGLSAGIIAIAATFATLLTPYGIAAWYAVAQSIKSPAAHYAILEWKPLIVAIREGWLLSQGALICYFGALALFGALAITVILTPREQDWPLVAVAAVLIVGAFISVRNIPLALLGVFVPLVRHSAACLARWQKDIFPSPRSSTLLGNQPILAMIVVAVLIATGFFSRHLATMFPCPEGAVAFMRKHSLHGNILNDDDWGSYLMWHCAPQSRIFIDSRLETVYPGDLIMRYLHFLLGQRQWQDVVNKYPNDFVLIGVKRPAYPLMLRQRNWSLIYRDQDAALFAPSGSPATKLRGVPVVATAADDRVFP